MMPNGTVVAIFIAPTAGALMQAVDQVTAEAGQGLVGDRYHGGQGSFNRGKPGSRQVTFMNARFFRRTCFKYSDSRRNIFVEDVELMSLIGKDFSVGSVVFRGVKYCDPCGRPSQLLGTKRDFKQVFFDVGGLVAEVVTTGVISVNDPVVPPRKNY